MVIGARPGDDLRPHAAYEQAADMFLVVWQDRFPDSPVDMFARYVSPDGSTVGTSFTLVANRTGPLEARAIGGGNVFLVAWREGPDLYAGSLYGQLVEGSPANLPRLLGQPFLIHEPIGQMFALAYNRELNEFVVVWIDRRHSSLGPLLRGEVYARRVSPQGQLLGQEVNLTPAGANPTLSTILSAPGVQGQLSLAFNPKSAGNPDGEYLLTYSNYDCRP